MLAFNSLLGAYRSLGMPLFQRTTYTFTPVLSTSSYTIGSGMTLSTPYPLRIIQAWRNDSNQTTRIPVDVLPDYNFNLLPTSSGGFPIQMAYQPLVNSGILKLWPTPDAAAVAGCTITIVYQRPAEYFSAAADTLDMPEEWHLALIYNLAAVLAPEWGIALPDRKMLDDQAKKWLTLAEENGTEQASLFFQVDRRGIQP